MVDIGKKRYAVSGNDYTHDEQEISGVFKYYVWISKGLVNVGFCDFFNEEGNKCIVCCT